MNKTTKVTTLYTRKDEKTLDMRFKSNKEYLKSTQRGKFDKFMQKIANITGSTKSFGYPTHWKHWFNPWYQLHRVAWKFGIMWPYKL